MPEPKLPRQIKKYDPEDPNPCSQCSNCCEYISLQIDRPTTLTEYDEITWYLVHKDVFIYIESNGDWFIQFNTPCEKLVDQRCDYYAHRPAVCRDYQPDSCIRYGDGKAEKYMFKNEVDYFRYLAKHKPRIFKRLKDKINVPFTRTALRAKKPVPVGMHQFRPHPKTRPRRGKAHLIKI